MDRFIEEIPSSLFSKIVPEISKQDDNCVKKLYSMLMSAKKQAINIHHNVKYNSNRVTVNDYVKVSLEKYKYGNVYYFPIQMIKKVSEISEKMVQLQVNTGKRIINMFFFMDSPTFNEFTDPIQWNTYLSQLKTLFCFLDDIAPESCAEILDIIIYLTDEKKELPVNRREKIGVEHVNSAFSNICQKEGEIVIYRKEEWFKVLIHECMHNYGIDFSSMDQRDMATQLFQVFPMGANIEDALFSETYTETWAELINAGFMAMDLSENPNTFSLYFHFLIQIELLYSLTQTQKILYHYDLSYESLLERNATAKYQQSSHVFEYYILKTVLLCNYGEFLCWADKNMRDMIFFPNEERKMADLCEFIKQQFMNGFLKRAIIFQKYRKTDIFDKGLRMSICEF